MYNLSPRFTSSTCRGWWALAVLSKTSATREADSDTPRLGHCSLSDFPCWRILFFFLFFLFFVNPGLGAEAGANQQLPPSMGTQSSLELSQLVHCRKPFMATLAIGGGEYWVHHVSNPSDAGYVGLCIGNIPNDYPLKLQGDFYEYPRGSLPSSDCGSVVFLAKTARAGDLATQRTHGRASQHCLPHKKPACAGIYDEKISCLLGSATNT